MSMSTKDEKRALSKDEFDLISQTRHKKTKELSKKDLQDILSRLREQRDKARDLARRQRREMRGKQDAKGRKPAESNQGQTLKKQIFASAIKRINTRLSQLEKLEKREAHVNAAERAFERKKKAQNKQNRPDPGRTEDKGLEKITSDKRTVKAIPREKGRVSQFVKNAQAKRDNAQAKARQQR